METFAEVLEAQTSFEPECQHDIFIFTATGTVVINDISPELLHTSAVKEPLSLKKGMRRRTDTNVFTTHPVTISDMDFFYTSLQMYDSIFEVNVAVDDTT